MPSSSGFIKEQIVQDGSEYAPNDGLIYELLEGAEPVRMAIEIAAGITDQVIDYKGGGMPGVIQFLEPTKSGNITIKINGGAAQKVNPFHAISVDASGTYAITSLTASNADAENPITLYIFGMLENAEE